MRAGDDFTRVQPDVRRAQQPPVLGSVLATVPAGRAFFVRRRQFGRARQFGVGVRLAGVRDRAALHVEARGIGPPLRGRPRQSASSRAAAAALRTSGTVRASCGCRR